MGKPKPKPGNRIEVKRSCSIPGIRGMDGRVLRVSDDWVEVDLGIGYTQRLAISSVKILDK